MPKPQVGRLVQPPLASSGPKSGTANIGLLDDDINAREEGGVAGQRLRKGPIGLVEDM